MLVLQFAKSRDVTSLVKWVYRIRHQRLKKGRDQGSQPWDLESQRAGSGSAVFFMGSGIKLRTKTGAGIKILIVFGTRDQHFG